MNFITHLSTDTKNSLIERNVVQIKKNPDGTIVKNPADTEKKVGLVCSVVSRVMGMVGFCDGGLSAACSTGSGWDRELHTEAGLSACLCDASGSDVDPRLLSTGRSSSWPRSWGSST